MIVIEPTFSVTGKKFTKGISNPCLLILTDSLE